VPVARCNSLDSEDGPHTHRGMARQGVGIPEFTQQAINLAVRQRYDDLLTSGCSRGRDENGAGTLIDAVGKRAGCQQRCRSVGPRALPELEELNFMEDATVVDETERRLPSGKRRRGHERIVFGVDLHRSRGLGARQAGKQTEDERGATKAAAVMAHRVSLRQIRNVPEAGIMCIHPAEADNASVSRIFRGAAKKLPGPVIAVMRDAKDRSSAQ
jgi:hypothetical protein